MSFLVSDLVLPIMPDKKSLKTGKYTCAVANCGGVGGCVHDYISRYCPFCDFQLVRVSSNGHIFCSNHESFCEYEEFNDDG